MTKRLRFSKIYLKERAGALMLVYFLDDEGNLYDWCPTWEQVDKIFLNQINVERFNKPESEWLGRFTNTAQKVITGAQEIKSAEKVSGIFTKYREDELVIDTPGSTRYIKPVFEVTTGFLDAWLGSYIDIFVINDLAFRIREYDQWGNEVLREYPKK